LNKTFFFFELGFAVFWTAARLCPIPSALRTFPPPLPLNTSHYPTLPLNELFSPVSIQSVFLCEYFQTQPRLYAGLLPYLLLNPLSPQSAIKFHSNPKRQRDPLSLQAFVSALLGTPGCLFSLLTYSLFFFPSYLCSDPVKLLASSGLTPVFVLSHHCLASFPHFEPYSISFFSSNRALAQGSAWPTFGFFSEKYLRRPPLALNPPPLNLWDSPELDGIALGRRLPTPPRDSFPLADQRTGRFHCTFDVIPPSGPHNRLVESLAYVPGASS